MEMYRALVPAYASPADQAVMIGVLLVATLLILVTLGWVLPALWSAGQEWLTDVLEDDAGPTGDVVAARQRAALEYSQALAARCHADVRRRVTANPVLGDASIERDRQVFAAMQRARRVRQESA